jgi:hypothetical protein
MEGLLVRGGLRSSMGSDFVAGVERWSWSNELYAGVAYGDGAVELGLPLVWRSMNTESVTAFGDIALRGSVELLRHQTPASSDTLRLLPALFVATSTGRVWQWSTTSQAVAPQMGLGYRHSDQQWAVSASAFAALPIALKDAAYVWGPSAGACAAFEYAPWQWLEGRVALDFKHQWAAADVTGPLYDSQSTALLAGIEAKVRPMRKLAIAAAFTQPLFSLSQGQYQQSRTYRLGVELAL